MGKKSRKRKKVLDSVTLLLYVWLKSESAVLKGGMIGGGKHWAWQQAGWQVKVEAGSGSMNER